MFLDLSHRVAYISKAGRTYMAKTKAMALEKETPAEADI